MLWLISYLFIGLCVYLVQRKDFDKKWYVPVIIIPLWIILPLITEEEK